MRLLFIHVFLKGIIFSICHIIQVIEFNPDAFPDMSIIGSSRNKVKQLNSKIMKLLKGEEKRMMPVQLLLVKDKQPARKPKKPLIHLSSVMLINSWLTTTREKKLKKMIKEMNK